MSEVEDSRPEMFGVNSVVITIFMIIVLLIVPLGYFTREIVLFIGCFPGSGIYGLFWIYGRFTELLPSPIE